MRKFSALASQYLVVSQDLYKYLKTKNITNDIIRIIAAEETELDKYTLSVENLIDLIFATDFISATLEMQQSSETIQLSVEGFFARVGEMLAKESNLRTYESIFEALEGDDVRRNICKLLDEKAETYKTSATLSKFLYNSRYCFVLDETTREYTVEFKHLQMVKQSDSATIDLIHSSRNFLKNQPCISMAFEELRKKMLNLHSLKN